MAESRTTIVDWLTLSVFLCVFPLDATWYMLSMVAGIPKLPLGFAANMITLVVLLPLGLARNARFVSYALLLLLLFAIVAALQSPFFDFEWLPLFVSYLAMLAAGFALGQSPLLKQRFARRLLILVTLLCAWVCAWTLRNGWGAADGFNYLRTSMGLTISGMFALSLADGKASKLLVYVSLLTALTYLQARTFLYLWLLLPVLAAVAAYMEHNAGRVSRTLVWVLAPISIVGGIIVAFTLVLPQIAFLADPRIAPETAISGSSSDFDAWDVKVSDSSINARLDLMRSGWDQIMENQIFGFYKGFTLYESEGGYMHNLLSYWHQFGGAAFLIVFATRCRHRGVRW